jgi:hypothetical protein
MTNHDYTTALVAQFNEEFGLHQIDRHHENPYLSLSLVNGELIVAIPVSMTPKTTHLRYANGDDFLLPTRAIVYYRWVADDGRPSVRRKCPDCGRGFDAV